MPVAATGLFCQRVHEKHALFRCTWDNQTLNAFEIAPRLLFRVAGGARRKRFEKAVAAGARMASRAPGVPLSCTGEDRLHTRSERFEIQTRRHCRRVRAHPSGERLPLRIALGCPVLAAAMPMAAAGFLCERIGQQYAFQGLSRHNEALDTIEVPPRLLFRVGRRTRSERLEKTVAAGARMTRRTPRVTFSGTRENGKHSSPEHVEVEARRAAAGAACCARTANDEVTQSRNRPNSAVFAF